MVPALWAVVGDYAGDRDRADLLDRVLSEKSKSVAFVQAVARERSEEYARNLRIFWECVLHSSLKPRIAIQERQTLWSLLKEELEYRPWPIKSDMEPDEFAFLKRSVAQKRCPQDATREIITRVLHHRSIAYQLGRVESLNYAPCPQEVQSESQQFSLVVQELGVLKNLKHLTFEKARRLSGQVDLIKFKALECIDLQKSGLKLADLYFTKRLRVWSDESPEGRWFESREPTFLARVFCCMGKG
ncbi:MAG: hypothetical protein ACHQT8_00455 [Chlamydiales bacterium]